MVARSSRSYRVQGSFIGVLGPNTLTSLPYRRGVPMVLDVDAARGFPRYGYLGMQCGAP